MWGWLPSGVVIWHPQSFPCNWWQPPAFTGQPMRCRAARCTSATPDPRADTLRCIPLHIKADDFQQTQAETLYPHINTNILFILFIHHSSLAQALLRKLSATRRHRFASVSQSSKKKTPRSEYLRIRKDNSILFQPRYLQYILPKHKQDAAQHCNFADFTAGVYIQTRTGVRRWQGLRWGKDLFVCLFVCVFVCLFVCLFVVTQ